MDIGHYFISCRFSGFYRNGPKAEKTPTMYAPQGQPRRVSLHHLAAQVCPVLCKVRLEFRQEAATEKAGLLFLEGSTELSLRQL